MPDRGNALGGGRSGEGGGEREREREREGVCFLVSVQLRYAVQSEAFHWHSTVGLRVQCHCLSVDCIAYL